MGIPWVALGYEMARLILTLGIGLVIFSKVVIPGINERLSQFETVLKESRDVLQKTARFTGMKASDYKSAGEIEGIIGKELIEKQIPELGILKMMLSPSTWEQVEEMLENNPAQALALYEKFGPQLKALSGGQTESDQPDF